MKRCTRCGFVKEVLEFHRRRASLDGLAPLCKSCASARARTYYGDDAVRATIKARSKQRRELLPDETKAYSRRWHVENKDAQNARRRAHHQDNREATLLRHRSYYLEHRESIRAAQNAKYHADPAPRLASGRRYRLTYPDRVRATYERWARENQEAILANVSARRARKKGAFVERVYRSKVLRLHAGLCGICGEPVDPHSFHVDHIVPLAMGGEHSYANTQPAHPRCNLVKGARPPDALAA